MSAAAAVVEEEEAATCSSSNSICPSKSTVYLGNISYSLTNNDLIKMVEHCGRVVCAKVAKDKVSRKSKGYAFIQFLQPEAAAKCVQEYNGVEMFGRKWNCSIAVDNGRAAEFIRKRVYPDKTRCYECGEFGHLSYNCPKNALGDREPPPKKKRRKRRHDDGTDDRSSSSLGTGNREEDDDTSGSSHESDTNDDSQADSLHAAINFQREKAEEEEYREAVASGNYRRLQTASDEQRTNKPRFVRDGYFSDEEALEHVEDDDD